MVCMRILLCLFAACLSQQGKHKIDQTSLLELIFFMQDEKVKEFFSPFGLELCLTHLSQISIHNFTCLKAEYNIGLVFAYLNTASRVANGRKPSEKVLNFISNAATWNIHEETHKFPL